MPLKIRWVKREYFGIALMLFGLCAIFQAFYIFIAQYFLSIGNYLVIILIPIGVIFALFYCSIIIYESYAQVQRSRKIKRGFAKRIIEKVRFRKLLEAPVVRPLLIIFAIFSVFFFPSYFISIIWFNNIYSFVIAEVLGAIACIFIANIIERHYAKIQRY
ncbi:MAG: hypothetical protein EU529_03255 [Promethearchaeota archaeon]|nr:MAG: hypothetical protein EU529_03255 [Candidatus Lokiarchaeota archaeon]